MLPGGFDAMYRAALATSHQPFLRVDVLDGNQNLLESDLTYISGGVSATLTSRVTRDCDVTFDESLYPFLASDLLAPYGNMLKVTRGIEFADGSRSAFDVFLGRIQDATLGTDGTCQVSAADLSADVLEVKFLTPQNSQPTSLVGDEVRRLISDALPDALFGVFDVFAEVARTRTWQLDRGQALDELATSVGAFWYVLPDGRFVLRRYPWTVPSTPVVTYSDSDGGSVVDSSTTRTRDGVFNSLTVTGERLNGDQAVFATAQDDNPASPTFIFGPFGRRHQLLRLQTPGTQQAAQGAASDNLRRLVALSDAWSWSMTVDAALELGDTVLLNVRGRPAVTQVVTGFKVPFDLSGPMQVSGRSRILGTLEGVE
ncbi:MAG: DUF5047 domain-containing protein [Nitrospiraceae bacterium]